MKSIGAKLNFIYIFLSIMSISFFTVILYNNQIDLITNVTHYETKEAAENIYTQLYAVMKVINHDQAANPAGNVIENLVLQLKRLPVEFILYNRTGENIFQSHSEFYLKKEHLEDAEKAFTDYDTKGHLYYSRLIPENSEMLFFVPVRTTFRGIEEFVFFFKLKADINPRLETLYSLILFFAILTIAVYILFVLFLHRIVIMPLKTLSGKSNALTRGNTISRIEVHSHDEIGKLAITINTIVNSMVKRIKKANQQITVMQKEIKAAARIQKTVYPQAKPYPFFDMAVYHKSFAAVSGDFYDVIPLDKDHYGILIADASGHGVSTALIVMLIKSRFQAFAPRYADLRDLMKKIHYSFKHLITEQAKFFTAFYLVIDKNKVISFSNAAHPRPFILRPGVKGYKILDTDGFPIGLPALLHKSYDFKRIRLMAGDKIVLYTDGMINAINRKRKPYGLDRLQTMAARNAQHPSGLMLKNMLADFEEHSSHAARLDDETLIIIEII